MHEAQHPDGPTWCVHCGTFDVYFATTECCPEQDRRFDSSQPRNFLKMLSGIFGEFPEVSK